MSVTQDRTETLEERVARLELRLQDGFTRIGEMMAQGIAVEHWERAWIDILREYESIEDILREEREAVSVHIVRTGPVGAGGGGFG